jgi:hypothetical protein
MKSAIIAELQSASFELQGQEKKFKKKELVGKTP